MIQYVENKKIDWKNVNCYLEITKSSNQWSNGGPISKVLESWIENHLQLKNKKIIAVNSGTSALHALVNMYNYLTDKKLKWITSAFSFPCCIQGPLMEATIVDCDEQGRLPLNNYADYDGVIIHNPFGTCDNDYFDKINKCYNDKLIIVDSCTAIQSVRGIQDEFVSLHHTKPWGFGEGGFAVVAPENEELLRSICNFGLIGNYMNLSKFSNNYKISETSCAFALQRLIQINEIKKNQNEQYNRIVIIANNLNIKVMNVCTGIPVCVPLVFENRVNLAGIEEVKLQKYYKPLANTKNAKSLYDRIVCFPCHREISKLTDVQIENILFKLKVN